MFYGYGLFRNYNKYDMKLKVQWHINDEPSEEIECEKLNADIDEENQWHTIDLRELGCKPIKCDEGDKIHCKAKVLDDDQRRVIYGYSGYADRYSKIEGQEYDFDTEYSQHNDNSTSGDWGQIPFILYAPL